MGLLKRVRSLPTMDQLSLLTMDVEWPSNKIEEPAVDEADLASMTSKSTVEDILTLLQSKRGERGATVHGSNVWALMKAAAEARELELAEVKKSNLCDDPELNQAALESQDMWYWPGETQDNAAEDDEEAKDMWAWEIDKKTSMMERIEQRISDAMWNWIGDIEAVDEEEDQEEEVAIALNLEPESMWDWSWEEPRDVIALSSLLWDWSWTPGARSKEAGKGESFSKEESQFRSELFWNWSWRRDESIEPIVRAPTLKPHVLVREDVKLPDADGMWDWSWKERDDQARADLLWDWSWAPTTRGWSQA